MRVVSIVEFFGDLVKGRVESWRWAGAVFEHFDARIYLGL